MECGKLVVSMQLMTEYVGVSDTQGLTFMYKLAEIPGVAQDSR
jgi:hypothetical protein